jgi:hypothetical protein
MDRRTALMQAVEAVKPGHEAATYLEWAEPFYQWLRSSVPAGGGVVLATPPLYPPVGASSSKADIKWAEKISPPVAEETVGGEGTAYGEGVVSLPLPDPNHEHQWVDSPKLTKYQVCAIPNCYETKRKP